MFPWKVACGQEVGNNSALKQIISIKTQFQTSILLHYTSKHLSKDGTSILRLIYKNDKERNYFSDLLGFMAVHARDVPGVFVVVLVLIVDGMT